MVKKFFGVAWRVGRSIIVTLLIASMCLLSLMLWLFVITDIIPVILLVIANILLGIGLLIIVGGILILVFLSIRKGADVYKILSTSKELTAKEAWDKVKY